MKKKRHYPAFPHWIVALSLICIAPLQVAANVDADSLRPSRISYGVEVNEGYHFPRYKNKKPIPSNRFMTYYGAHMEYRSLESDSNRYDMAYGLPALEVGVLFGHFNHIHLNSHMPDVDYRSRLGNQYTLYYGIRRDLLKHRRLKMSYTISNGISINSHPYDSGHNVDNEFIGSRLSIFFGTELFGEWQMTDTWAWGLNVGFRHFSNSAMDRPNKGTNTLHFGAHVNYSPTPVRYKPYKVHYQVSKIKPDFYLDISAGWEGKALLEEWYRNLHHRTPDDPAFRSGTFEIRTMCNAQVAAMFRYNLKYASGLGIDYGFCTYTNAISEAERAMGIKGHTPKPHILGVSLRHEIFYKQFSLALSVGGYPYRHMGHTNSQIFYETVGVRYYPKFLPRCYFSYNVKAHGARADGLQFNLGYQIMKSKTIKTD